MHSRIVQYLHCNCTVGCVSKNMHMHGAQRSPVPGVLEPVDYGNPPTPQVPKHNCYIIYTC